MSFFSRSMIHPVVREKKRDKHIHSKTDRHIFLFYIFTWCTTADFCTLKYFS